jgi:hypothetical protein
MLLCGYEKTKQKETTTIELPMLKSNKRQGYDQEAAKKRNRDTTYNRLAKR